MSEAIHWALSRWVKWHKLVGKRRGGPCVCGSCVRCRARTALAGSEQEQRCALVELLDGVCIYEGGPLRYCDCRQCLECLARAALRGEEVTVPDRKMTAVVGADGRRHLVLTEAQDLRAIHRRRNPMRCGEFGTVSRYWTGWRWRCTECDRRSKEALR